MREVSAALLLFVVVASLRVLSLTGLPDDHYVHLAGAQQMLYGEWPSRDFVDLGAPLTYAISAAAQALFGQSQLTEVLLMACAFGLGVVLTVRAGVALTGSVLLGVAAALLEILVFPRTYSYPKMVLYAATAVALLWYANRPTRARIVSLAALVVFAALVRHDHGFYIGLATVVAVALSPLPSDRYRGGESVAVLIGAGVVFMLPYLIYLQTVDGILAHLQRGAAFTALEVPRQRLTVTGLSGHDAWLLAMVWLAPLAALVALVVPLVRRREGSWSIARRVMPIVVLAIVANLGLIRDRLDVRLPDAIVAPALLMSWLVFRVWRMPVRPMWVAARVIVVIALLVTMRQAAVMGAFDEQLNRAGLDSGIDRIPEHLSNLLREMERPWAGRLVPSAPAGELRPFFDYVPRCIPRDDRLLVAAFLPEIVVLAQRPFAGGQVWFMPGGLNTPADHALVMQRLQGQRVPVVVLRRPAYGQIAAEFPELDKFIRERYTDVAHWSLGDDDAVHLLMNVSQSSGTDARTGWPCFRRP